MIHHVLCYTNSDFYDKPNRLALYFQKITISQEQANRMIRDLQHQFKNKMFQSMHLVCLKMAPESGVFEVIHNEYGEHPMLVIKELNPKAAEAKKKGKSAVMEFDQLLAEALPEGEPQEDDDD